MIVRLCRACLFCALVLSDGISARAQAASSSPASCGSDACPVLRLAAFLDQVQQASPAARALRLADDRAAARLLEARGRFDPYLSGGYEYKTDGSKDKLNVLRSGLTLPLDMPLSPSLTLDYRRGVGASIDPSVLTSPAGETRFGISLMPLQGLGISKRRAALRTARLEPRRATAMQTRQRNRLLLEATQAFWTWVEAQHVLQINQDLLALATQRRTLIVRRARAGEAAAIDSVEAELSVVRREGKVADARRKAEEAAVKLSVFLWNDDGTPQALRYAPPPLPSLPETTVDSVTALTTALARRPELRILSIKQQQMRIERQRARERLRPDVTVGAQMVSYDNSPFDAGDVKLGVKVSQPLFFRSGRGDAENAEAKIQALRFKEDLTQQKIRADVIGALVALRQLQRRVQAADRQVALARRLQQAERRRFNLGESTLFLVNQREDAFAKAREERVAARIDGLQAEARYRWATGTIGETAPAVPTP